MTGGGAVNSIHMTAFHEKSNSRLVNKNMVTFERNRLRKLPPQHHNANNLHVNNKQNPPSIEFPMFKMICTS